MAYFLATVLGSLCACGDPESDSSPLSAIETLMASPRGVSVSWWGGIWFSKPDNNGFGW